MHSKKIELREICTINFSEALNKLIEIPIPATSSWNLSKTIDKISEEQKRYNKIRMKTLKKFAKLDNNGEVSVDKEGHAKFKKGKRVPFDKEIGKLLDKKIDIPMISMSIFGKKTLIEPRILFALKKIMVD